MSHDVQDFEQQIIQRSHQLPVLVDFWATWCGPCRMLGPVLEKLADQAAGRWELAKVNVDDHPIVAQQFNIASIPNVKLFHRGAAVDEFVGVLPEPEILRWLEKALPSPNADRVAEAQSLLEAGKDAEAIARLKEVLAIEPLNHTARLLLAEALLASDVAGAEKAAAAIPGSAGEFDRANPLRELAALVQQAEQTRTAHADQLGSLFLEGITALRQRRWETALEQLLSVVESRKNYADGAVLTAVRSIFRFLGPRHPAVAASHRRFSSAVNA